MTFKLKLFFSALLLSFFAVVYAAAVSPAGDAVGEILAAAEEMSADIDYSFVYTGKDGRKIHGNGSLLYQNGMFKLRNEPFVIYDNGVERVTLNKSSKEAVREKSFSSAGKPDENYVLRMLGFNPKGSRTESSKGKNGKTDGIRTVLRDGTVICVSFKSVKYSSQLDGAAFSFDTSALGGAWTVTDLR